ncbi:hypothetical protein [Sanyastnella coralliicola]|uniref:hypothetical protein n=1 Tax=Sanyastnella coralliicola TaxID=3069118 RepID=UPI0027BA634E|nr:hypothetical protein [Longitalea sp. SCSIO 12813]
MHWIKFVSSLLFLFISMHSHGQQIDLGDGDVDFLKLPFNQRFISRNDIKTIMVDEQMKRSNQAIKDTGKRTVYEFSTEGDCTARSTYRSLRGRLDTIVESFGLDHEKLDMLTYRREDQRGVYTETFEIRGDTTEVCRYRGKEGEERRSFLSCESLVHKKLPKEDRITTLNEQGLPYQERIDYYDDNGYLEQRTVKMLVTRQERKTQYAYDEKGRLSIRSREVNDVQEQWSYSYDESGLLWRVVYREDNQLIWRKEILHDEGGFITAIITKDEATEDIVIERFSYEIH